jgi:tryptophan-rich sensory protein
MVLMNENRHIILPCFFGVVICLLIAGIEGWVTASNTSHWYYALNKPFFNPPSFLFAPVWTVLYIMIGVAAGLIWQRREKHRALFSWFILQLIFNFLWSFFFFAGESIRWALIDILLLWITLLITLGYAYKYYITVVYWLTPYFLWVTFATVLNFSIWILNN